jgi:hypothetical protein
VRLLLFDGALRLPFVGIALLLAGCGVNGLGAADADIVRIDGGTVVTSWTYGLHLNTEPGEAGIVLGYSRSVRVLAGEPSEFLPGQYPFGVWLGNANPVVVFRRVAGLEIGLSDSMVGLSLGVTEQMSTAPVDANATMSRRLFFVPDHPDRSMVRMCDGNSEC